MVPSGVLGAPPALRRDIGVRAPAASPPGLDLAPPSGDFLGSVSRADAGARGDAIRGVPPRMAVPPTRGEPRRASSRIVASRRRAGVVWSSRRTAVRWASKKSFSTAQTKAVSSSRDGTRLDHFASWKNHESVDAPRTQTRARRRVPGMFTRPTTRERASVVARSALVLSLLALANAAETRHAATLASPRATSTRTQVATRLSPTAEASPTASPWRARGARVAHHARPRPRAVRRHRPRVLRPAHALSRERQKSGVLVRPPRGSLRDSGRRGRAREAPRFRRRGLDVLRGRARGASRRPARGRATRPRCGRARR
jgi:hypothetical protein